VLVNRSDTTAQQVTATFAGCGDLGSVSAYQYDGGDGGLHPLAASLGAPGVVSLDLPPWSVTTIRLSPKG
jgi:hypothetical protein